VIGSRVHDIGVYRPQHEWKFDGKITFKSIDTLRHNVPTAIAEALGSVKEEAPASKPKRS
jgi:hypothetical protein